MNQHLTTNTAFTVCIRWSQRSEYVQHYSAVSLPRVTPQGVTVFDLSMFDGCSALPLQMLSALCWKQTPKDFIQERQKTPQRQGRLLPTALLSHSTTVPGTGEPSFSKHQIPDFFLKSGSKGFPSTCCECWSIVSFSEGKKYLLFL